MRKILLGTALLALALASCQNDGIADMSADDMVSVKAVMGLDSRTVVDNAGTVTWTAGDKMLVYGGDTEGVLTLEDNGGGVEGTFSGFVQGTVAELTTALYPAEMADTDGNITLSQVTYPNSNSPMVATWNNSGLQFSHLTGMVRLQVLNVPDTQSVLVLHGEGIGGVAKLDGSSLTVAAPADMVEVLIPAGNGGKLTVDVPVFASVYGNEVELTVSLNGKVYKTAGETGEATVVSTFLKVGAISSSSLPEMEVDASGDLTDRTSGVYEVSASDDLKEFVGNATDGDIIRLTENYTVAGYNADKKLIIDEAVTLDLGGNTLTTECGWGGIDAKGGCTIKNGIINHTGNTAAIKAFQVESIEDVDIVVAETAGKIKGGIVVQEGAGCYVGLIRNVTISGATNGIETYRCGARADYAIGRLHNVTIDAGDTGFKLSAPVGTATDCTFRGGNYGIDMYLYGPYSVSIDLKNCTVTGATGIYAHDEKGLTNPGSLQLTYDASTTIIGDVVQDFEDEVSGRVSVQLK